MTAEASGLMEPEDTMLRRCRIDERPGLPPAPLAAAAAILAALAAAPAALGAAPDGNVEWNGLSHMPWLDRAPRCPVDGQPFTVSFQSYADDLTSARVRVDAGGVVWADASRTGARGPYDVWTAQVPATAATQLSYWFEVTDGADTDYLGPSGVTDGAPASGYAVNYSTYEHAPVGATPLPGGGAVFRVWCPTRTVAHVRGQFNGWGTGNPMTKTGEFFAARVPSAAPGQMYKYYFQNSTWNTDPRARRLNPGDNYNAVVVNPGAYAWQVDDFDVPDFEEMVVYQLHIGTFAGRNDPYGSAPFPAGFPEVEARADHLAELGVNCVMFCPFTEFPWDYSAGYNPITAWTPESAYGTPDEVKAMVDALHARGIAVIHDIVWNHFSYSDNFLWNYDGTQIYFDDPAVQTPWGSQADFDRGAVRDYFVESAFSWLDEYRMDGFRMDATDYMNIPPQEASGWSLMQRLNDDMDRRCVDKICIAEQLPDDAWVTRPTSLGGAGFDSQYHDAFTDRLREEIFDAAYGDPEMWKIRDIVNGSGQYLSGRFVVNYLELHDEAWPSSGGQRIVKSIDTTFPHDDAFARGRVKLAQGLVFTAPGIPAVLMGTEWLEDTDFGTDSANRIDWSKKTTYAGVFEYFRDLIARRRTVRALRADAGVQVFHLNEGGNVIAFQRYDGAGGLVVVVANFSNGGFTSYRVGLPGGGAWTELVNSQDAAYGGSGATNPGLLWAEPVPYDGFGQSVSIAVPAMALIVLANGAATAVDDPDGGQSAASLELHLPFPNPTAGGLRIAFDLASPAPARVAVYDVAGRLVRVVDDSARPSGRNEVAWDGRNDAGQSVAAGVYVVRVESGESSALRKAVLLR
jgi:1,4-alpha-glucan branching enzyme